MATTMLKGTGDRVQPSEVERAFSAYKGDMKKSERTSTGWRAALDKGNLGVLVDRRMHMSQHWAVVPRKGCAKQVGRGSPAPLHCPAEATSAMLCPVLGPERTASKNPAQSPQVSAVPHISCEAGNRAA